MKREKRKRCPVCGARIRNGRCVWCGEKEVREEIPVDASVLPPEDIMPFGTAERAEPPAPFFWERRRFCILLLIVCFPAGIILMYSYGHFRPWQRALISSVIILLLVSASLLFIPSSPFNIRFDLMPSEDDIPPISEPAVYPEDIDETVLRLVRDEALSRRNAVKELVSLGWDEAGAVSAVDSSGVDFLHNAILAAEWCTGPMAMSRAATYEQLTSIYGEGFSPEEASEALLSIEPDYLSNARIRAGAYRALGRTREETLDILVSEWGEGFTREEAEAAVGAVYAGGE